MNLFWVVKVSRLFSIKYKFLIHNLTLVILLSVFSCKNTDSDLGLNLMPDKGEFYSAQTDTFTINAFTVKDDSVKTDSLSSNILGSINDPLFGTTSSSVASQLTITQTGISFGAAPKVDSVVLYIKWDKNYYYGNLKSIQSLKIYELNEKIEESKQYFSNHKISLGSLIGTWSGNFNHNDSLSIKYEQQKIKVPPGLAIKLQNSIGEKLATANSTVYSSVESFLEFFKGIAIISESTGLNPGEGGISAIDMFSGISLLMVYYNDSLQHNFELNNNCSNFNIYDYNHSNPDITNQIANKGKNYSTTYIQTMGSCKTKIEIPHLLNLVKELKNERIIVNEAALIFTPLNGTVSTTYTLPLRLNLFQPDIKNHDSAIIDFVDYIDPSTSYYSKYGGSYNTLSGDYTIRFTRQLQYIFDQYLINGKNINKGFFVKIPSDRPVTPTRIVLDNSRNGAYKFLKFRITYTKIKI